MKTEILKLDKLFSEYIRRRDKLTCQRCGREYDSLGQGLHCAHIVSRRHKSTRWDSKNALALCFGCHQFFHGHPLEFWEFLLKRKDYTEESLLVLRYRSQQKWSGDWKLKEIELKRKLAELEI